MSPTVIRWSGCSAMRRRRRSAAGFDDRVRTRLDAERAQALPHALERHFLGSCLWPPRRRCCLRRTTGGARETRRRPRWTRRSICRRSRPSAYASSSLFESTVRGDGHAMNAEHQVARAAGRDTRRRVLARSLRRRDVVRGRREHIRELQRPPGFVAHMEDVIQPHSDAQRDSTDRS